MKTQIHLALALSVGLTTTVMADTHVIEAYDTSFVPTVVDAAPGDTIRWEYVTGYPHSVTSGTNCTYDGLFFDHYPLDVFEWVVPDDAPAQVPFFCDPHCDYDMTGVINVIDPGHLVFGIIDLADVYIDMGVNQGTGEGNLWIESNDGHFALGFEVEGGDVEIDFNVGMGNLYLTVSNTSGAELLLGSGTLTMTAGSRFALHGEDGVDFTLSWQDEVADEGVDLIGIQCHECSVNVNGDMASFRAAADGSYLNFRGEGEITMSVIGDVTSSSLTLPGFAEEADVYIPAGVHTIDLNATVGDHDLAWLLVQMGDDGDGGDEGCAEDVNDDGVVNVNDLLAIIAAWGNTCP